MRIFQLQWKRLLPPDTGNNVMFGPNVWVFAEDTSPGGMGTHWVQVTPRGRVESCYHNGWGSRSEHKIGLDAVERSYGAEVAAKVREALQQFGYDRVQKDWPTREQWEAHWRWEELCKRTRKLSKEVIDYTTAEACRQAIVEARSVRRQLTTQIRLKKAELGDLWKRRHSFLQGEDYKRTREVCFMEDLHSYLDRAIKLLEAGKIDEFSWPANLNSETWTQRVPLLFRVERPYREIVDALRRGLNALPQDDAGWEKELERRRLFEFGNPQG
jgi:hypothetical protein